VIAKWPAGSFSFIAAIPRSGGTRGDQPSNHFVATKFGRLLELTNKGQRSRRSEPIQVNHRRKSTIHKSLQPSLECESNAIHYSKMPPSLVSRFRVISSFGHGRDGKMRISEFNRIPISCIGQI
jgi:hypothetical protein